MDNLQNDTPAQEGPQRHNTGIAEESTAQLRFV
jgi:hypothetical protein